MAGESCMHITLAKLLLALFRSVQGTQRSATSHVPHRANLLCFAVANTMVVAFFCRTTHWYCLSAVAKGLSRLDPLAVSLPWRESHNLIQALLKCSAHAALTDSLKLSSGAYSFDPIAILACLVSSWQYEPLL